MKKENKKNSDSEEIKEIAKQLLLKNTETEYIGASPEYLAKIAMIKAKSIYESFKVIDSIKDDLD
jgi:hypothetical protein